NDYIGKGLSGGKIVVTPPSGSVFKASENVIIGNVAFYGATSGTAFVNGKAGERFMVRNSGAIGVCEGVGDHGLEYMTGGIAVILGETGKNFAAGMSGGVCYIYDANGDFHTKINQEFVTMSPLTKNSDIELLKTLINQHISATGSARGTEILAEFNSSKFIKVMPNDYNKMLDLISDFSKSGLKYEQAVMNAFTASLKN
ncbi:MAG: glutamate synthase subunit alpha, partial [Clostridia bacterium]